MKRGGKKIQVRFIPGDEDDVIDYLSRYKKNEVHSQIISALRMKMNVEGYYSHRMMTINSNPPIKAVDSKEGVFDLEAMETFGSIDD